MAVVERQTGIDAVTLEVLRNGFVQICNEVTITLLKTAPRPGSYRVSVATIAPVNPGPVVTAGVPLVVKKP